MRDITPGLGQGAAVCPSLLQCNFVEHLIIRKLSLYFAIMPDIYGCSNKPGPAISLHSFPTDNKFCRQWINFVKNSRKWDPKPRTSKICSAHFEEHNFTNLGMVLTGKAKKLKLTDTAVPTIQIKGAISRTSMPSEDPSGSSEAATPGTVRGAARKREVLRVIVYFILNYCLCNTSKNLPRPS